MMPGDASSAALGNDLLRAPPGAAFDRITRLAALAFGVPMAAVSLTDETCQWFTSRVGPIPRMAPRAGAPCFAAANGRRTLALPDLCCHPEFGAGLLARQGVRFFAGAPLVMKDGTTLGAVCVMGPQVRETTAQEIAALNDLAALAMVEVELRRAGGRVDPLSGLPNRHEFMEQMHYLGQREPALPRVLALIDLARPEELSHMLNAVGSATLDDMVRQDAQSLRATLGRNTRLYHVAATQFALIGPSGVDADAFAAHLQERMPDDRRGAAAAFSTTCTTGLAVIMPGEAPPADLLRRAHAALDDARTRRAPLGLFSPDQEAKFRRAFTLLNDFPAALADDRSLRLAFQPRLDLATGECVGVEALLRWTHPTLGEVPPGEFVRLIEKTTMARGMMHWVLAKALAQLKAWSESGLQLQMSVNVSPANLEEPDFAAHVLAALDKAGLPRTSLELEVTENALLDETGVALPQLRTLSEAGVFIAIDDFGTGYSSLSYLQRLPIDVVKIDQSFIRGLTAAGPDDRRHRTLVTALIGLSHDLGYRVVAEGIETQAVADMLRRLECDEVQGYHFGRPMPPASFLSWHAQRPWTPAPRLSAALGRGRTAAAAAKM